jgi:hypothetical protein
MDLALDRSQHSKTAALLEVICAVEALQGFLARALRSGCAVVHG